MRAGVEELVRALEAEFSRQRAGLAKPLDRWTIYEAMRAVSGACWEGSWDAMPMDDERVGAVRLILSQPSGTAGLPTFLLVTFDGRCFVEGQVPTHPAEAAEYLDLRRRCLEIQLERDGTAGRQKGLADVLYDAMCDRIAAAIADCLVPPGTVETAGMHPAVTAIEQPQPPADKECSDRSRALH